MRHCSACRQPCPEQALFCSRDGARTMLREGLTGRRLGSYRLEGLIGEGGFGQVYVAVAERVMPSAGLSPGSAVAVKVIVRGSRTSADWAKLKRAQAREIAVARRLRHPGLLAIHDAGEEPDLDAVYIVMPLGGRDLKLVLADEGPGAGGHDWARWRRRALGIGAQVGEALAHLHANGVFHRDVKPQNVIEAGGRIVLIDYGISKDLHAQGQSSTTDVARGTPEYLCPDYFRGGGEPDWGKVDQYGLGVLLYELLVGQLPFDAPPGALRPMAIVDQHVRRPPPDPRERRPELSPSEAAVVLRLLEKEPAKRFPGFAAVDAALRGLLEGDAAAPERRSPGAAPTRELPRPPAAAASPVPAAEAPEAELQLSGLEPRPEAKEGEPRWVLRL